MCPPAFQSTVTSVAGQTAQGLSGAVASVDTTKLSRGFQNLSQNLTQTVRERAGTATDVTELPQGEARAAPVRSRDGR